MLAQAAKNRKLGSFEKMDQGARRVLLREQARALDKSTARAFEAARRVLLIKARRVLYLVSKSQGVTRPLIGSSSAPLSVT